MAAQFEIFKSSKDSQFYFRLRSGNNKIILASTEGYTTKQSCRDGISSVKTNAPYDSRYARKDAAGNYTFVLNAANGEPIGKSESYTTRTEREDGISAVKRDAPNAPVVEL